jgi:hypothetical protein
VGDRAREPKLAVVTLPLRSFVPSHRAFADKWIRGTKSVGYAILKVPPRRRARDGVFGFGPHACWPAPIGARRVEADARRAGCGQLVIDTPSQGLRAVNGGRPALSMAPRLTVRVRSRNGNIGLSLISRHLALPTAASECRKYCLDYCQPGFENGALSAGLYRVERKIDGRSTANDDVVLLRLWLYC